MESPDQFAFGFDDVERRSVQFSRNRDDEHHERHDAQTNQVPVPDAVGLRGHDVVDRQRPGHEHDRHDRHAEGGFVTDHLALARTDESSGYFEPEDHPASMTP